jgi:hypothetical protein
LDPQHFSHEPLFADMDVTDFIFPDELSPDVYGYETLANGYDLCKPFVSIIPPTI